MKKRIILVWLFFIAFLTILSCSVNAATNVLIISEEATIQGGTVATMLGRIAPDSFTIEKVPIANNMSLSQTVAGMSTAGKTYDSVIVQLPYESIVSGDTSVTECVSAIKTLYAQIGSTEKTQYFIGTPVGRISNAEAEIKVSDEAVEKIIKELTTVKVTSIPVFENLKAANDKSLGVYADNKLTELGNLLVACTYSNSLGKKVTIKAYDKLPEASVSGVVEIANGTETPAAETPTTGTVAEEPKQEEKIEDTDVTETIGTAITNINREPIMEMVTSDPTGLKIIIYDKEKAGIKTASLMVNDANGTRIEPDSVEGEKVKSYVFKIDSAKLLDKQEYKQFYIYAEDNDGCILREYFRVKYSETAENGSNYKINRAPRIRPKLLSDTELTRVDTISLYVMDQTGIQRVTPKTVEENGFKAVNLFADGKYNGYDGIEKNYAWRDVKGATTTSSKTYVKEAYTQFQDINEFFKYENSESKVSLLIGDKKFRFNAHAVDATGLATDKIMIIDFSDKKEESDTGDGVDEPSSVTATTSATNTTNTTNTTSTTNTANTANATNTANTVNTVNTANAANTANTANKTASSAAPKSSAKTAEETGNLKTTSTPGFASYKTNREPRLKYIIQPECLYIEVRDCKGVACEYPSGEGTKKIAAQKNLQPKIYYYKNDKRGAEVKTVLRPKKEDYQKNGVSYVYRIGLPSSEMNEEYTKFEIVAYDVTTNNETPQLYIDEVFSARINKTGTIVANRAPTSNAVVLRSNLKTIGLHAVDGTGISTIALNTLPKSKGNPTDSLGWWNGTTQKHWKAITYVTNNKKYVKNGLTTFEKVDEIFKNRKWIGMNPKVSGKDGVYTVMVEAADATGSCSTKTMRIDTKYYISGDSYTPTGNGKTTTSTKKSSNSKSSSSKSKGKKSSLSKSKGKKSSSSKSKGKKSSASKSSAQKTSNESNKAKEKGTTKKSEAKNDVSKDKKSDTSSGSDSSGKKNGQQSGGSDSSGQKNGQQSGGSASKEEDLRRNSKGEEVKKLQKRLNELGWNLSVDGDFGPNTEAAVIEFQTINDLTPDGVVGPKTRAVLYSDKAKGKGSTKKSEDKKTEDKKTEDKKTEDKKTEDKKTEDKKTEDKKSDDKDSKNKTAPEKITISGTKNIGGSGMNNYTQLSVNVTPGDASKSVSWSTKSKYITVDSSGKVTKVSGAYKPTSPTYVTATVTATSNVNAKVSANYTINVYYNPQEQASAKPTIKITCSQMSFGAVTLGLNQSCNLYATVSGADDAEVLWKVDSNAGNVSITPTRGRKGREVTIKNHLKSGSNQCGYTITAYLKGNESIKDTCRVILKGR